MFVSSEARGQDGGLLLLLEVAQGIIAGGLQPTGCSDGRLSSF